MSETTTTKNLENEKCGRGSAKFFFEMSLCLSCTPVMHSILIIVDGMVHQLWVVLDHYNNVKAAPLAHYIVYVELIVCHIELDVQRVLSSADAIRFVIVPNM